MKPSLLILLLSLCQIMATAQPYWNWVKTAQENNNKYCGDIATGLNGDIYITSMYTGSVNFDGTVLNSVGNNDVFLAKYSSTGQVLWVRSIGGSGDDEASAIATDKQGNIFIGGAFKNDILLDNVTLTSVGDKDIFLAKYSATGDLQWAKSAGGQYKEEIGISGIGSGGLATDEEGNLLVTGMFSGYGGSPPIYGTATFDNFTLTSNGNADVFVVKYDMNGNAVWAKNGGGKFSDVGCDVACDSFDNVLVTGSYNKSSTAYFDTFKLNAVGYADIFVAKYDKDGIVKWAKSSGGASIEEGRSIAVGPSGNAYVTGATVSNSIKIGTYTLNNLVQSDGFVACYDTAGSVLWAKSFGWWGFDLGFGIASDADENIYVTGSFNKLCIFGNDSVKGNGSDDIYIAKYKKDGQLDWGLNAGGNGSDAAYSIAIDEYGQAVITGRLGSDTSHFMPHEAYAPSIFTAKLNLFPSSINDAHQQENSIIINPNPALDVIHIQHAGQSAYQVRSITGQAVLSGTLTGKDARIDVHSLPAGMYLLQLSTKREQHTMKFMKL